MTSASKTGLIFSSATEADVSELAALHAGAAEDLTRRFGPGPWSSSQGEGGVRLALSKPKFSRIVIALFRNQISGTLHLQTKKPWAIDVAYFTPVKTPLYLTGMAVHPDFQGKGIGRLLMKEAELVTRAWPADAIRLDAWDAAAGAGSFYAKCGMRELAHVKYKGTPLIYFELVLAR